VHLLGGAKYRRATRPGGTPFLWGRFRGPLRREPAFSRPGESMVRAIESTNDPFSGSATSMTSRGDRILWWNCGGPVLPVSQIWWAGILSLSLTDVHQRRASRGMRSGAAPLGGEASHGPGVSSSKAAVVTGLKLRLSASTSQQGSSGVQQIRREGCGIVKRERACFREGRRRVCGEIDDQQCRD
jgi:hypothetical protein